MSHYEYGQYEYSQDGQDKFLELHVFDGFTNGFFVDVGAHNGVSFNNTLYFEEASEWKGINIEANPTIFPALEKNRPACINLSCAISNVEGTAEFYTTKGYAEMLSGLVDQYDPRHKERLLKETSTTNTTVETIQVPTRRLASVFKEYNVTHVNYLSIDVEGAEFSVLQSIDFDKVTFDVIGYEVNYKDSTDPILSFLESKGFVLLKNTGLDTFVIHRNSRFFQNVRRFLPNSI
jgi:FkbM family methyltransferase